MSTKDWDEFCERNGWPKPDYVYEVQEGDASILDKIGTSTLTVPCSPKYQQTTTVVEKKKS